MFDLNDETAFPIVLVGNPTVIHKIMADPQQASRVLQHNEAKFKKDESLRTAVRNLLKREMPLHAEALELHPEVAKHDGHLRKLKQHLRVTAEFLKSEDKKIQECSIEELFASAHETLITKVLYAAEAGETPGAADAGRGRVRELVN